MKPLTRDDTQRLMDHQWRVLWRRWRQDTERIHARRRMAGLYRYLYE